MNPQAKTESDPLEEQAEEAARFLKQIANDRRLIILCRLGTGEATVSQLCESAGLSASAMSQHLAKLRIEGLVTSRKQGLLVYYRIADPRCLRFLDFIKSEFCPDAIRANLR